MLSEEFITTMESFIADGSKKIHKNAQFDLFSIQTIETIDKLLWQNEPGFEYYGVPFDEFGIKNMAFYKSLNGTIYSIELVDEYPIAYYEVFNK